jgi:acyl-coenzyme A thioesterase PaaI-like protein
MPADSAVLSVEFKVNLLAPAVGDRFVARAEVKRAGKTVTVCTADAIAIIGSESKVVATMLATMMRVAS